MNTLSDNDLTAHIITNVKFDPTIMKFISWNVNGLRAVCGKGFNDIFASLDADFFCLQETKLSPGALELEFEGYKSYWNLADRKGYSGTAIYTCLLYTSPSPRDS